MKTSSYSGKLNFNKRKLEINTHTESFSNESLKVLRSCIIQQLWTDMIDRFQLLNISASRLAHTITHILLNLPVIAPCNIPRHSQELIFLLSEVSSDDEGCKHKAPFILGNVRSATMECRS